MSVLASEIDKLTYYLKSVGREKLTEADVDLVSSESREIAAFDFANAILDGNAGRALSILSELRLRKEKPEIILSGYPRHLRLCAVKARLNRRFFADGCTEAENALVQGGTVHKKRIKNRLRKAEKACIDLLRRRYKDKNHSA